MCVIAMRENDLFVIEKPIGRRFLVDLENIKVPEAPKWVAKMVVFGLQKKQYDFSSDSGKAFFFFDSKLQRCSSNEAFFAFVKYMQPSEARGFVALSGVLPDQTPGILDVDGVGHLVQWIPGATITFCQTAKTSTLDAKRREIEGMFGSEMTDQKLMNLGLSLKNMVDLPYQFHDFQIQINLKTGRAYPIDISMNCGSPPAQVPGFQDFVQAVSLLQVQAGLLKTVAWVA
ncbi:MAG: hypothetical protein ACI9BD_001274 [Candidatus Marinamargulisbacteria bacterium]|jgi:hypothetical protein